MHTTNHINRIDSAQLLGQNEEHLCYVSERIAIHQEMKSAFNAMVDAAKADAIELTIASGFRSFDRQLVLWNNKFSGKTVIKSSTGNIISPTHLSPLELVQSILLYSALPGASRHHWGCDIDVYAPNLLTQGYQLQLEPWEYSEQGPLAKLSAWLVQHAHQFGFYFPYAKFQGGVAQEPWHISYLPLAQLYQQAFDIKLLAQALNNSSILGKRVILDNLDDIASRYINNVCAPPINVILPEQIA
ncbi:M15 family metallopeptidase [Colwellia psychrerythraea]|uniref:Peptidase M15B and M15C DD-carboxypeptidase VanY/endolysin n=1 Tax=Colwellia psychrerythraea TaxID=28229 RepID=A0A099K7G8_COLPS|nr:M15 family metallopeptidase [Colwellia psychrerythraea]KGJ86714.1 peptidase M15B and M15C DD-carboxypeptidase VanY/endolysin [Colwellia psychrerythraea]